MDVKAKDSRSKDGPPSLVIDGAADKQIRDTFILVWHTGFMRLNFSLGFGINRSEWHLAFEWQLYSTDPEFRKTC